MVEKYNQRIIEIKKESAIKKSKTIRFIKIASPIVAAVITFTLLTAYLFIPLTKYNQAEKAYKNGDYDTAISLYDDLYRNHHDFKNSVSKINPTKYRKADTLVKNGEFTEAQKIFEELGDFENSADRVNLTKASQSFSNNDYLTAINFVSAAAGVTNITFDADGGNEISNKEFYGDIKVTLDDIPSAIKIGHTFNKWELSSWEIDVTTDKYKANVTLKANYTANSYNLTYELNGGSCGGLPYSYCFGELTKLPEPIRKGYSFEGWSFGKNEKFFILPDNTVGNKKLYANWNANSYTITYNANDGAVDDITQTVVYDNYFTVKTPSRDAYTFAGWYDGDVLITSGIWTIANNITLTARWTKNEFKINYNLNGGINDGNNPSGFSVSDTDIIINKPTKTGYSFIGWSGTGLSGNTKNLVIAAGTWGDLSFTANWQANNYTITYDYNDGTTAKTTQNVTFDSSYKLIVPTRNGYKFGGWFCGNEKIADGTYKTPSDITLKATWKIITYTISYDLGGGTVATANSTKYTVETATFTLNNPTKTGYTFTGWIFGYSDVKNLTAVIEKGSFGDLTFTACYAANNYTLSFNVNGGDESITAITVTYDKSFTLPTPARTGYTFDGWYYNGNAVVNGIWEYVKNIELTAQWTANADTKYRVEHWLENADDDEYTLMNADGLTGASDSVVTPAVYNYDHFTSPSTKTVTISPDGGLVVQYFYTRKSYTVSFVSNGGKSILPKTKKYESTLSSDTSRTGYDFGGWYYEESLSNLFSGKMSGEDFTLYAYWLGETLTNEFEYKIVDSVATITKFTGKSTDVVVPTYINNAIVSVIGNRAFENCTELKNITLTNGYIETIENGAFFNCIGLTSVVIPDSVQNMGAETFAGCSNLSSLTIPFVGAKSGVKSTDSEFYPFGYIFGTTVYENSYYSSQHVKDNNLFPQKSYYLPSSLKTVYVTGGEILDYAFENCVYIESIQLLMNIKEICESSFMRCSRLKRINFPDTITQIKNSAFEGCSLLESISLPSNLQIINSKAFANCYSLSKIVVPDSVIEIQDSAFAGCDGIVNLSLPFVGKNENATYYEAVLGYIFGYTVITVGLDMDFESNEYLNDYMVEKDDYTQQYSCRNERVFSGRGFRVNGYYYQIPKSLKQVTITRQVNIQTAAFNNCKNLESIILPKNVESIGKYAFQNCVNVKQMILSNKITTIDEGAYNQCGINAIYYLGSQDIFNAIKIMNLNDVFTLSTIYYFSKSTPPLTTDGTAYDGNYWHYDTDGITPKIWEIKK